MQAAEIAAARASLLGWYDEAKRDLPWRRTRDPYAIWVSEIMLQQTRVTAVAGHYARFMKRFPTVISLALANVDDVLSLWSGLGYYQRARLLQRAAQVVVQEHGGQIPREIDQLRRMPGVGVYTAAAVGSIAYGVPVAAVDGNVERVLARLEGEPEQRGGAKWQRLAQNMLDVERPGDFNQAMMELGATVCLPRGPKCGECPVYEWCRTRGEHVVTPRKVMRSQQVAYGVADRGRGKSWQVWLEQRPLNSSIMAGMWELPELDEEPDEDPALIVRHSITNTNYYVRIYRVTEESAQLKNRSAARAWVRGKRLEETPLTGLARKVLKRMGRMVVTPELAEERGDDSPENSAEDEQRV
jgi:A/G-specific adenine glycosylase